jgi:hypothetical protein
MQDAALIHTEAGIDYFLVPSDATYPLDEAGIKLD